MKTDRIGVEPLTILINACADLAPVLTARISEDHAITSGQMDLLANIVRGLPRLSADPDLIAKQSTGAAFQ